MSLRHAVSLMFALLLAACAAAPPPPPPPTLALNVVGGADQNPDPDGHPTPVAVRIYELAGTAAFERADVFALTERTPATLGSDTLGSEEFIVGPGETRAVEHPLKTGVQAIGVVVLFRDIDRAQWRAVAPAAASGPTKLTLQTAGTTVTLAPTAPTAPAP
jgi:type VI secretion system protein VasD